MVSTSASYLELSTNPIGADGRVPIGTERGRLDQWNPFFCGMRVVLVLFCPPDWFSSPCPSHGTKIIYHDLFSVC